MRRVLILGGTAEGRELAAALAGQAEVLSSLAGVLSAPMMPPGEVRVGGFGGVTGLLAFLRWWRPSVVVDATHPYADQITAHAAEACALADVPLVVLRRPGWTGDFVRVPDLEAAAAVVRGLPPGRVFLTTGRRDLWAFAGDQRPFLVRSIEAPEGPTPPDLLLVLDRGPYTVEGEVALMAGHAVVALVSKDSGGTMVAAKLVAAERLGLPVVLVERPELPPGLAALPDVAAVLSAVLG